MGRIGYLAIAAVIAAATVLLHSMHPAHAIIVPCLSTEEKIARMDSIFSGTVLAKEFAVAGDYRSASHVTFAVDEVWKGPVHHTVTITSIGRRDLWSGIRGQRYHFELGSRYLVYAYKKPGGLAAYQAAAWGCESNKLRTNSGVLDRYVLSNEVFGDDLEILGRGQIPGAFPSWAGPLMAATAAGMTVVMGWAVWQNVRRPSPPSSGTARARRPEA